MFTERINYLISIGKVKVYDYLTFKKRKMKRPIEKLEGYSPRMSGSVIGGTEKQCDCCGFDAKYRIGYECKGKPDIFICVDCELAYYNHLNSNVKEQE